MTGHARSLSVPAEASLAAVATVAAPTVAATRTVAVAATTGIARPRRESTGMAASPTPADTMPVSRPPTPPTSPTWPTPTPADTMPVSRPPTPQQDGGDGDQPGGEEQPEDPNGYEGCHDGTHDCGGHRYPKLLARRCPSAPGRGGRTGRPRARTQPPAGPALHRPPGGRSAQARRTAETARRTRGGASWHR